ncbi:MAG: hypothetical protein ACM3X7_07615 [Solirubrobacterales bacterium]
MKRKVNKYIYWTPRILSILFVAFLAMFSLDVITPEANALQIALGLFIHNIPALILLIIVIISWKREIVGGIAFILAGFMYIIFSARSGIPWYLALSWSLTIALPAIIVGILYMLCWFKKKQ